MWSAAVPVSPHQFQRTTSLQFQPSPIAAILGTGPNTKTNLAKAELLSEAAESELEDQGNEAPEITYDEHLHPARPRSLRFRPRVRTPFTRRSVARDGTPTGDNPAYV